VGTLRGSGAPAEYTAITCFFALQMAFDHEEACAPLSFIRLCPPPSLWDRGRYDGFVWRTVRPETAPIHPTEGCAYGLCIPAGQTTLERFVIWSHGRCGGRDPGFSQG